MTAPPLPRTVEGGTFGFFPFNATRFKILARAMAAAVLCLTLSSCGYRLAGQSTRLPDSIRTIAIPVFLNNTSEPDLEFTVTRAIIDKFQHDGRLDVVREFGADSVLKGVIENYSIEPVAFDSSNKVSQYRVKMKVKILFKDKGEKGIKTEKTLEVQWDYTLGPSIIQAEISREGAIYSASAYLGDKLIGLLLEGF